MYNCVGVSATQDYSQALEGANRQIQLFGVLHGFPTEVIQSRLLSSKYRDTIKNLPSGCVITGSFVLYLYGILDREPTDLDVIAPREVMYEFGSRKNVTLKGDTYTRIPIEHVEDLAQFNVDGYKDIDIFVCEDYKDYTTYQWVKLDNISNIIREKVNMNRFKDLLDLQEVLQKLNEKSKVNEQTTLQKIVQFTKDIIKF